MEIFKNEIQEKKEISTIESEFFSSNENNKKEIKENLNIKYKRPIYNSKIKKNFDDFLDIRINDLEKLESISFIKNAYPQGEGLYISDQYCIYSDKWLNLKEFQTSADLKIFNKKYEINLKFLSSNILDLKNVTIKNNLDNSIYMGGITVEKNKNFDNFNNDFFPFDLNFLEAKKNFFGKITYKNGEFFQGEFKDDLYDGSGFLFQPIYDHYILIPNGNTEENTKNQIKGIEIRGIWFKGKLNGKGSIFNNKNKLKEMCEWRFGRIITSVISSVKKLKLKENILEFLNEKEISEFAYKIKSSALLNFLRKNNSRNLMKIKIYESLTYNKNNNKEEFINFFDFRNLEKINKEIFNHFCKEKNLKKFFDYIFITDYLYFIPAIGIKVNGGYPNKELHYSNAFDPSRNNSYCSNFLQKFDKNIDITGIFLENNIQNNESFLDKLYRFDKFIKDINNNNKEILKKNSLQLKNEIEYAIDSVKGYIKINHLLNKEKLNENENKEIFKFFFNLKISRIFGLRYLFLDQERSFEPNNLEINGDIFAKISEEYKKFYLFDYNTREIYDQTLHNSITLKNSNFLINRIIVDVPFDSHKLHKLTLPVKTIAFFLHKSYTKDFKNFSLNNVYNNSPINLMNFINDDFLKKFDFNFNEKNQLYSLLKEFISFNKEYNNNINNNNNKNKNIFDIIDINNNEDNIFIEFDTNIISNSQIYTHKENINQSENSDSDVRLLGLCFIKDHNLPNIINLRRFFHIGKMISVRLVNQNILCDLFNPPSSIDLGSVSFNGIEI